MDSVDRGVVPRRRRRYPRPGNETYDGVHRRVRAERGSPDEHPCADCGAVASDWSYDNADPREFTDRATGCAYSDDVGHYQPRCRSCHRKVDWAHRRRRRPPLDAECCLLHYRAGLSLRAIGGMYGYTVRDVRELLVKLGEPIRPRSAPVWSRGPMGHRRAGGTSC